MNKQEYNTSHVQSVARAIKLVELLAEENREMSLTEISKAMDWPKSTVHGLIATLRDHYYVDQSPTTGCYYLGIRLFELGNIVARSWEIRRIALPVMQNLNRKLGEMIQLAKEDKGEVLYLEKLDSTHMLRIVSEIGARLPMHCSGLGKILLAYKKPAELKSMLSKQKFAPMTAYTITDRATLEKELAQVRAKGYAMDNREIMDSLRCVAAPIYDRDGNVLYAISVSGLANSLKDEWLETVRTELLSAADSISFAMGHRKR
ncbi:MAG: IclR family transcriptional regulator, partial [Clostridiales bacterium]|jgi:DNA-binding IclR family transcriptional regulator|nr:IclR family transcriptional regulator [Clostridiales bacterium]